MGLDLFATLRDHATQRGDEAAVRVIGPLADEHPDLTWAQLDRQVGAVAAQLGDQLPQDAVVMVLGHNRPSRVPVFLGVLHSGRTVFPVDASLTAIEFQQLVDRADVDAIIADDVVLPRLESVGVPVIRTDDLLQHDTEPTPRPTDRSNDAWLLLQSSGTTGGPKIVKRSGPSLDAVAHNVAEAVGLRRDDRVVAAVPLSHSYGIENGMLAPIVAGACALHHVVPADQPGRGFDPTLAVTSGATVLPGVPAMFEMIDRMGAGRGKLRLAYSAGATLPPALANRLEERDGLRLGQLYGSTEIGSVTFDREPHHVGKPMTGVDIRILAPEQPDPSLPLPDGQEGHVAVRGPSMFSRYLGPDELTADSLTDGYFLTGDLGRLDADGALQITGRLKLLIDVGGVKVNPIEVEQVLVSHPQVAECVVVPDPVSPTINRVKAVLTAANGEVDQHVLRSFLRERLAAHKVPRTFEVRAALPKSPTGKVLRRKVQVPA
ncbi:class I adenylate-forming enzyme family protein [Algisphaera agarilytica]|uniref:Acyl-CoA synthetase (AMP-forming)/AMP-acid ligase II n=1 Tax=Algisphaera agarilytica TaxID=1385975 RepID=A0A7X0LKQ2_9BACT|nr:class I adenylate-forming enzyme family protein [Algisphaera agarilytica]MBB6430172.1 acyl-CoA synthetase (AMP-forming)/AMP-acid ligase II [Algisphaera agarilytica]